MPKHSQHPQSSPHGNMLKLLEKIGRHSSLAVRLEAEPLPQTLTVLYDDDIHLANA